MWRHTVHPYPSRWGGRGWLNHARSKCTQRCTSKHVHFHHCFVLPSFASLSSFCFSSLSLFHFVSPLIFVFSTFVVTFFHVFHSFCFSLFVRFFSISLLFFVSHSFCFNPPFFDVPLLTSPSLVVLPMILRSPLLSLSPSLLSPNSHSRLLLSPFYFHLLLLFVCFLRTFVFF